MTGRYSIHWQLLAEQTRGFVEQQQQIINDPQSTENDRNDAILAIENKRDELLQIGHHLEDMYNM